MHLSYVPTVLIIATKNREGTHLVQRLVLFLFHYRMVLSASPPHFRPSRNRVHSRTLTWVLPRGGHHEPYRAQYLDRCWRARRHPGRRALSDSRESFPPNHRREGLRCVGPQGAGRRSKSLAAGRRPDCEGLVHRRRSEVQPVAVSYREIAERRRRNDTADFFQAAQRHRHLDRR